MGKVLVMRTCNRDLRSNNGFQYPESGFVEAPDFSPVPQCGHGLHGLLWGEGDGSLLNWSADARWQVLEVESEKIIDLAGKVKFPRGEVVHTGSQESATQFIFQNGGQGKAIVGLSLIAAGNYGTATAGYNGTATAGNYGTATAGNYGTATAGYNGTATAGYNGTATAGYNGTATAGDYGTATAGDYGIISVSWYDHIKNRMRIATGYVGEDGIEPNLPYKVVGGKLVRAT